jgi:hypothetical protein
MTQRTESSPGQVREEAMALHRELRVRVREALRAADRGARGEASEAELDDELARLRAAVRHVAASEIEKVRPLLRGIDAWGWVRDQRLETAHEREARAVAPCGERPTPSRLRSAAREVLRALRLEEQDVLSADVWRDDFVSVDQSDG